MAGFRRLEQGMCAIAAAGLAVVSFTACSPSPAVPPTPSSASPEASGSASAEPSPTDEGSAGVPPATCEEIYSPEMMAELLAANPPLNDPGVTMLTTENADLLDILQSSSATLRCTWGTPGEFGLATTVTAIDDDQAAAILAALPAAGFGCEPLADGTVCRIEQKGITLDDTEYTRGEAQFVREGGWVSTAWINFDPEGYTEDIVSTIWG
ncbi:MAG: hypothetical protein ABWY55_07215 [Microbacterium sp.]